MRKCRNCQGAIMTGEEHATHSECLRVLTARINETIERLEAVYVVLPDIKPDAL